MTVGATGVVVRLDGGTVLARALVAAGVQELLGVPAGKLGPFLGAVAAEPRIRHLGTRHEASAAWMAAATFHATGRPAACYGEMGPGAHNLVGGLGTARANGLAVLVLTSAPPTHLEEAARGMAMAADVPGLMRATTKWSATASSTQEIPELVRSAVQEALSGRPGPVHLGLPADVLAASVDLDSGALDAPPEPPERRPASGELLTEAAALLRDAERPLLVAGGGVVLADGVADFRRLSERLDAAATATQMGVGTVSTADPGFFGHGGLIGGEAVMSALHEADVVLLAGCRLSSWLWEGSAPALGAPAGQAVIHLDIDPSAAAGVLPAGTLVLEGDARATLAALAEEVGEGASRADPSWRASLVATYGEHRARLFDGADEPGEGIHPAVAAATVGTWLPDDALVVYDGGHTTFWSNDLTPTHEPRTRFHDPGMAHLGFGLPYGIALQAAHPGRTVLLVTGDGAFGFTLAELDTARRYGLPVVTVIHDNAAWGVIRFGQRRAGFDLDTALEGTDYAAIARAFGCHGEQVTDANEIAPALDRARASGLPAVVDVRDPLRPAPCADALRRDRPGVTSSIDVRRRDRRVRAGGADPRCSPRRRRASGRRVRAARGALRPAACDPLRPRGNANLAAARHRRRARGRHSSDRALRVARRRRRAHRDVPVASDAIGLGVLVRLLPAPARSGARPRRTLARNGRCPPRPTAERLVERDDHVELSLRSTSGGAGVMTVRARFLVGADGAGSFVREALGIELEDLGFHERWLVLDLRPHDLEVMEPPPFPRQYCDPRRPHVVVPNGRRHRRWEFMLLPGEQPHELESPDVVWRLLAPWVTPDDATIVRHAVYEFGAAVASSMQRGRCFLVGDAAHLMPPHMGEGMCSGLRDANGLAWKLALVVGGLASHRILESHTTERVPHNRAIVELSLGMGRVSCELDGARAAERDARLRRSGVEPPAFPQLETGLVSGPAPAGSLAVQAWWRSRGGSAGSTTWSAQDSSSLAWARTSVTRSTRTQARSSSGSGGDSCRSGTGLGWPATSTASSADGSPSTTRTPS